MTFSGTRAGAFGGALYPNGPLNAKLTIATLSGKDAVIAGRIENVAVKRKLMNSLIAGHTATTTGAGANTYDDSAVAPECSFTDMSLQGAVTDLGNAIFADENPRVLGLVDNGGRVQTTIFQGAFPGLSGGSYATLPPNSLNTVEIPASVNR